MEPTAAAVVEQLVAERTRELSTLLNVQQAITSRLEMKAVLQMIADGARQLTECMFTGVYLLEDERMRLAVMSLAEGLPVQRPINISTGYSMPLDQSLAQTAIRTGKPILVSDVSQDGRVYRDVVERTGIASSLIVPLMAGEQALGILIAADHQPGGLTAEDEHILSLLATSAVIGLENARLYREAEENAALAERSRLARDLHDAVTQSLFSSSLIADVLPQIWENDPQEGRRRLEELRQSTRGALAEMRSLLLELRPAALQAAEIGELLKHLANASTGRMKIPVQLQIEGSFKLPTDVKICLYRIAQEALNNIAKHAEAEAVQVRLAGDERKVRMEISDDGLGFDAVGITAEHLGLKIMRERAEAAGAELAVDSRPGEGTCIVVVWNSKAKKDEP